MKVEYASFVTFHVGVGHSTGAGRSGSVLFRVTWHHSRKHPITDNLSYTCRYLYRVSLSGRVQRFHKQQLVAVDKNHLDSDAEKSLMCLMCFV